MTRHAPFSRVSIVALVCGVSALITAARVAAFPNLFKGPEVYETGSWPLGSPQGGQAFAAATGDLNKDAHLDLVVASFGDENDVAGQGHSISVLLGSPSPIVPPLFQAKVNYETDPGPNGVVLVDLDLDSNLDIVTANPGPGPASASLSVLLNNGNGTFQPFVSYAQAGVVGPIAAADVNGDGAPDIVAAVSSPVGFMVMTGDGGGAINVPVFYATGAAEVRGLALRDVTGDGRADVITANGSSNSVTVFRGSISGVFSLIGTFATGSDAADVTADFLSGDVLADLAVACNGAVSVLVNAGSGTFPSFTSYSFPGVWPWSVRAGDMNGDFKRDLVVSVNGIGVGSNNTVRVLGGHGDGTFDAPVGFNGISGPGQVVLGDFDIDGSLDVALPAWGGPSTPDPMHNVYVLLNDGAGQLASPSHATLNGIHPHSSVVANFNGDGKADVAVAFESAVEVYSGNGLGAFTFTSTLPLPSTTSKLAQAADIDRDGDQDLLVQQGTDIQLCLGNGNGTFAAPVTKISGFTMLPGSIADMNRDTRPDVIAIAGNGGVRVFTQDAGGNFVSAGFGGPPVTPRAIQVADWNRDGKPDLAIVAAGGIGIFPGNGDGSIGAVTVLNAGVSYGGVCDGDFNRDGKPDLAAREYVPVASIGSRGVDVFLGNGLGGFAPSTAFATLDPIGESIGSWDVDKDGTLDIVAESHWNGVAPWFQQASSVGVLIGDGQGQFQKRSDYAFGGVEGNAKPSAAFGDVNGDLDPDVIGFAAEPSLPAVTRYLSAMLASPVQQKSALTLRTDYPVGQTPEDVAVGDLNRDGKLDLVAASTGALQAVAVRLGNGDGTFGPSTSLTQSLQATRVRLGDLNRDGVLDLVALALGGPRASVFIGVGDGTFGPRVDNAVSGASDLELADTNRDGILDICVSESAGSIRVLPGIGNGGFGAAFLTPAPSQITDLELADMDSDGDLDVVAANVDVIYMPGIGGFQFGPWTDIDLIGQHDVLQLAVADVNKDGNLDIVAPTVGGSLFSLATLFGVGNGQFGTPQLQETDVKAHDIVIGHAENDGDLFAYLTVADDVGTDSLAVLRLLGTGGFVIPGDHYQTGAKPRSLALGDFNRDGLPDVAVASSGGDLVSIHLHGTNTITGVEPVAEAPTAPAHLAQNYPNPFNPTTTILFSTGAPSRARLTVFDVHGRLVKTLVDEVVQAGEHRIHWSGEGESGTPVASGVYFYKLTTDSGFKSTHKMVLAK